MCKNVRLIIMTCPPAPPRGGVRGLLSFPVNEFAPTCVPDCFCKMYTVYRSNAHSQHPHHCFPTSIFKILRSHWSLSALRLEFTFSCNHAGIVSCLAYYAQTSILTSLPSCMVTQSPSRLGSLLQGSKELFTLTEKRQLLKV